MYQRDTAWFPRHSDWPLELRYAIAATCCDWVVGVCDATTNNLRNLHTVPLGKIARVYNGTVPIQRVEKEQCPSKSGFTLVSVGRLAPVKNHALLLNAFRAAHSAMPGLQLWMVGDGIERPRLESLASELGLTNSVTFWGQQLDVAPFFSAADAFIMSSKSEGLPISLLQGFSLGLPAIVTDVGGMAEVVRQAKAGITVSATDASEMAAAILRLAGSEKERKQYSMNAEASFFARFTLETMFDAYTSLYRNSRRSPRARPQERRKLISKAGLVFCQEPISELRNRYGHLVGRTALCSGTVDTRNVVSVSRASCNGQVHVGGCS